MKHLNTKFMTVPLRVWNKLPSILHTPVFIALLTLPIIAYCLPLLLTGNLLASGDADYLMQIQEAARRTIFEYGQFPWWNPWVSGGVPLFANPQFGLYSIPSLFTLTFGSIIGYKLALGFYLVMGFWGFYLLFRKAFHTPLITAILLGYIWTFGSYFAQRIAGHYTFFTIEFFPFILLLFLKRKDIKHSWLLLGLTLGLMINAAAHNTTVMGLGVFGIFMLLEIIKISFNFIKRSVLNATIVLDLEKIKFLLLSGTVLLLIAGQRIYYSLEYLHEYPRDLFTPETTIGVVKAVFAIFGPVRQYVDVPSIPNWSWMEVSAYIGVATGVVAVLCLVLVLKQGSLFKVRSGRVSPASVLILGSVFFLFGLGVFAGNLSPYNLLHHLPIFSDMRVASRWLIWASMMVLIFISLYNQSRYRLLINSLLFISVVELFVFGSPFMARPYFIAPASYTTSSTINQQVHYDVKRSGVPYDENLTATTKSNIGQIITGDALIDTRQGPPVGTDTIRCDSDIANCHFVMTDNATVTRWSPNNITVKRTAPGTIRLNMNPGKYWLVNGRYVFASMRLAEPSKEFVITDPSDSLTLKLQPKFSFDWVVWKFTAR